MEHTFVEVAKLVRAGELSAKSPPVLVVGFGRDTSASQRPFRTRSEEGEIAVPPLRTVLADGATRIVMIAKRARSPYEDFVFVGRAPTCDLVFDDGSISKSHAAFQRDAAGWSVKDTRSRNGTYVDGVRLESGAKTPVASGAQITFGAVPAYFLDAAELVRLALLLPGR